MTATLVWLRRDLRLADQPALLAAVERGAPVVPVFVHAPEEEAPWQPGAASNWWLHHSLARLSEALERRGSRLILRRGPTLETLRELVQETGADAVFWNRLYEPAVIRRDRQIKRRLRESGLRVESFNAALLHEPWCIRSGSGDPYRVFSPFWKSCRQAGIDGTPLPEPEALPAPPTAAARPGAAPWPGSESLDALGLLPELRWDAGLDRTWTPGEAGAHRRLHDFLENSAERYHRLRDLPGQPGTSRLSPHLHFGEISPRQIVRALRDAGLDPDSGSAEPFLREIGWREFAHHLLFHFPHTTEAPLNPRFEAFPWRESERDLRAWQQGRTGIPIVDASMRELWQTGWMHNRSRMIVASLLTKNLRMHWLHGARWFWDTLVDADLASNTLGWQWTAGSGADAAPYFRIFNPVLQGERFDPDGRYVRRYVPELERVPASAIHTPRGGRGRAADPALALGYPPPIVDLRESRQAALEAFRRLPTPGAGRS
ncbi:cryptochrome/photolyase family protein [Thioalkalivibrio paradoxus]|uniref:Deoxyribodipyrimidine photo-lyase n=1 Tax=Thioalkalivibrio paradoxus ARh 1 TaxID=713585 RepID=W0DK47_9GAMM|nr:deoxyribodipyrimidine photo-lyase [Thioalkalivibrio paradoxus]AHE97612.1 deoxyribodipyrimidine photo-lyase [Thioalkalivibrio paradoxus ARh 1]